MDLIEATAAVVRAVDPYPVYHERPQQKFPVPAYVIEMVSSSIVRVSQNVDRVSSNIQVTWIPSEGTSTPKGDCENLAMKLAPALKWLPTLPRPTKTDNLTFEAVNDILILSFTVEFRVSPIGEIPDIGYGSASYGTYPYGV